MNVKFLDLGRLNKPYLDGFMGIVERVLRSGVYIGGEEVSSFEREFANYCGASHCVTVGNGLDALIVALLALDIGPGDEVIVPGQTFVATWLAVTRVGATIVPVDVESVTANLDASQLNAVITKRTKAIIPVHLFGATADMKKIMPIAIEHGLHVIEDSAQAHGDELDGKKAGCHGHIGCFSFYPTKNLGAVGDGGAVVTNNPQLAERMRLLANYGSKEKYCHLETGVNSRMDPVQAAFLRLKLNNLSDVIKRRQEIARFYTEALARRGDGAVRRLLRADRDCVWHNFVVLAENRANFVEYLSKSGVGTALHYPVIPSLQPCYESEFGGVALEKAKYLSDVCVSLPIGEYLNSEEVEAVASALLCYPG